MNNIISYFRNTIELLFIIIYRTVYLPIRVCKIRQKKIINVAFVISDLGKWKTELLFKAMQAHPRFSPEIYVVSYSNENHHDIAYLIDYLEKNNYPYHKKENTQVFKKQSRPDILFYQEPYSGNILRNILSLFCFVPYAFHTTDAKWFIDTPMLNIAWQVYYENSLAAKYVSKVMKNGGRNCYVTGLPYSDLFSQPLFSYDSPWKKQDRKKKKIIWAPHHTINSDRFVCHSTFLDYFDTMFFLANKYKDDIQMAFKPHPVLKSKLYRIWGIERTENYYSQWESGENTQLVLGNYVPLFLFSDAMIHDCGSFTVEYHYTKKPVMYLVNEKFREEGLNEFGRRAFELHYLGKNAKEIEDFITNVIEGKDDLKSAREAFYQECLLPPEGNNASNNIINAILS
ncbi:MAG: CDP-glycerol glycerophosphotransferase family protein [Bacteroidales bacterium]|nr:CDP-glycerol glycerophosphotransferase family protein [Bacteroidales bacterium]